MSSEARITIRELLVADLDAVLELWSGTEGLGLNESDTREALEAFLRRNPGFSAVARPHRRRGVARRLLEHCLGQLEQARIPRCNVFLYDENLEGAKFWVHNGWEAAATWKTLQRRLG